jgi:hypothetical protein
VVDPDHETFAAPKLNVPAVHQTLCFSMASASSLQINGSTVNADSVSAVLCHPKVP